MQIHRRAAIILSFAPFAMIGVIALWYGWVNYQAARDADAFLARLEAEGIPTRFERLFPPVENPEETMMGHPAMISELAMRHDDRMNRIDRDYHGDRISGMSENSFKRPMRGLGQRADVRLFFDPVRHETPGEAAREMLEGLAPEIERLGGLAEALARPRAGWEMTRTPGGQYGFDEIDFGDRLFLMRFSGLATDVVLLHLADEDPDSAVGWIDGIFDFHRHLTTPPMIMLDGLVSAVAFVQASDLIHEGVAHGVWEERHLAAFEGRLAKLAPQDVFVGALLGELAFMADYLGQMREGKGLDDPDWMGDWELDPDEIQSRLRELWFHARPRGMSIRQMIGELETLHRDGLFPGGAPRTRFELHEVEAFAKSGDGNDGLTLGFHGTATMLLRHSSQRYFEMKIANVLLRTGIALERHRLAHGRHPESLAALVPDFLPEVPLDPCDGKPLRYRLQSDGSPVVWSIGIDGIDEGGKPHRDKTKGDPVWVTSPLEGFDEDDLRR